MTQGKIKNFFRVSNAIEGIFDERESLAYAELFNLIKDWDYEKAMYHVHSKINYLNDYCISGQLRDYDVFVGGKKCLDPKLIKNNLEKLFLLEPINWRQIKAWHVEYEKIHCWGDGNGRVGRFLMLMQVMRNKIKVPEMFFDVSPVEENRQKYYKWFK